MHVSQGGLVYNGFGGSAGDNLNASQALSRLGSIAGRRFQPALFPAFDSVRQALPMVQAFLGMALVICIPVILLFSAWELKTVVTLSCAVRPVLLPSGGNWPVGWIFIDGDNL